MSTGTPDLSVTWNVTAGALLGTVLSTFRICITTPAQDTEFDGTVWAPGMEASNSPPVPELWQFLHCLSSICARLRWFAPVSKLTSSWHDPQAARPGLVFQLFACAVFDPWQDVQFRVSCGKAISE